MLISHLLSFFSASLFLRLPIPPYRHPNLTHPYFNPNLSVCLSVCLSFISTSTNCISILSLYIYTYIRLYLSQLYSLYIPTISAISVSKTIYNSYIYLYPYHNTYLYTLVYISQAGIYTSPFPSPATSLQISYTYLAFPIYTHVYIKLHLYLCLYREDQRS